MAFAASKRFARQVGGFAVPLVLAALTAGCAGHRIRANPPSVGVGWRYEVVSDGKGHELSVAAAFPPGTPQELRVEEHAHPYVTDVEIQRGTEWRSLPKKDGTWMAPECLAGCVIRYRFLLRDAAIALDELDQATEQAGIIEAPPSTWLLRPHGAPSNTPCTFHVSTPPEIRFVTGVNADTGGVPNTFRSEATDLEMAPYSAFGALRTHRIHQDGASLDVAIAPGKLAMTDAQLDRWISQSARAVTSFYHRFPLPSVLLMIVPTPGNEVTHGRTLAASGASIVLHVGQDMTEAEVPEDWVLTHELTHLAFPSLPRQYGWLEEGLATYVEPIARARIGVTPVDEVWRGLVLGLPKGLPRAGDRGLDHTRTWGRTYWGGALFCLIADLRIRDATNNKKGLEDALRGILEAGGNDAVRWDLERTIAEGDRATGVHVLRDLHARMGSEPVDVDLVALWHKLGVQMGGRTMTFNDRAPFAGIRDAITARDVSMPTLAGDLPSCREVGPRLGPCVAAVGASLLSPR